MKVKVGEYEIECTVEEFAKIRETNKTAPPPVKPSLADLEEFNKQVSRLNHAPLELPNYKTPIVHHPHVPVLAPVLTPLVPGPAAKIVRGVKSLVIGTVGRYGKQGLTRQQIKALSGLENAQVRDGLYSAMDEDQGPPLIRQEGEYFFCTEIGESYALVSDFGKKKIVHQELYLPNGKVTA